MPDTVATLITDSLLDIMVQGSDADMDPAETAAAIRYMNRYMTNLGNGLGERRTPDLQVSVGFKNAMSSRCPY